MKRIILSSDEHLPYTIVMQPVIINVEIPLSINVEAASGLDLSIWSNLDRFRQDVADMMMNEFEMNILEEEARDSNGRYVLDSSGNRTKVPGHITNRDESTSLYFGISYDLRKSNKFASDNLIPADVAVDVKCKVIIKVADHNLYNQGDAGTRKYNKQLLDAIEKEFGTHSVTIGDENLINLSGLVEQDYNKGLDEVRDKLIESVKEWRRKARFQLKKKGVL